MQLEVGMILEGKVTGITKFGAFVDLTEGATGMVHISEVAPTYVKEITDYVTEGQTVKVKVIEIGEGGKIALSMKKAIEPSKKVYNNNRSQPRFTKPAGNWQANRSSEPASFEDMMSKFKKSSDEKMLDLKRTTESKRGGGSRRGSGGQSR